MSTSLKVVSMAAVFWASLRRRAIVARSRVMRTRSSRAASSGGDGARTATAAAGCATGSGCAAARSMAASMSPLVRRPSLPVPGTVEASRPLSAASFRTAGASGTSAGGLGGAVFGACVAAGCWRGTGCSGPASIGLARSVFCSGRPAGTAPGPSLISPSSAPTATVSPSLTAMLAKTPAAGAGTSKVTLSVSSSTNGSSTATASPSFLNHLPIVASVTDSPRAGTRISAMIAVLQGLPSSAPADDLLLFQRVVQKLLELRQVQRHLPDRGRSGRRPAGVAGAAVLGLDLVEQPLQENIDEHPGAHVARLFLAPDDLSVAEAVELRHQRLGGERIELLDAQQINVVDAAFLALLVEIVIDLAGAQHDAANFLVRNELDLFTGQELRVVP